MFTARNAMLLLAVLAVALAGYDIWATWRGYEFTLTAAVRATSHDHPMIPCGFGLFVGYLLGQVQAETKREDR